MLFFSIGLSWSQYLEDLRVYHPSTYTLEKKNYELGAVFDFITSTGVYDKSGNEIPFSGTTEYGRIQSNLSFRYGISDLLEVRLLTRYRQNAAKLSTGKNLEVAGIESIGGGVKYLIYDAPIYRLAFNFEVRSLLSTEVATNGSEEALSLGEEGSFLSFGGSVTSRLGKRFMADLELYYQRPGTDQSDQVFYDLNVFYHKTRFALGLGMRGLYSMRTDPFSGDADNKPRNPFETTNTINSVDASYGEVYGAVHAAFNDNWRAEVSGGVTTAGEFYDAYQFITFGIKYQSKPKTFYEKKKSVFKEYDFEATVTKVSPRGRFVKIDRGLSSDLSKGAKVDIYEFDYVGGNKLVAQGAIYEVNVDSSIVRVLKLFSQDSPPKVGHIVRGKR